MVVIVGLHSEAEKIARGLKENQYQARIQTPDDTPAITSLVLSDPVISDIVFLQGTEKTGQWDICWQRP